LPPNKGAVKRIDPVPLRDQRRKEAGASAKGLSSVRLSRRHDAGEEDQRHPFARDRDRVLYCSHFRRLAGVGQVTSADDSALFHTRLTHTLKVAQLGRRLAEHVLSQIKDVDQRIGLHPEVVEAACLAHDLGHPPFGHLGEIVLDRLVRDSGDPEGYEGNAQSFRIVAKLALRARDPAATGLDLTTATFAALLKYPWKYQAQHQKYSAKRGYYESETEDFEWANALLVGETPTVEAALMDYADDIAYSVHDVEDFHRAQAIPWHVLRIDGSSPWAGRSHWPRLVDKALQRWTNPPKTAKQRLENAVERLVRTIQPYFAIYEEPTRAARSNESNYEMQRLISSADS
jgi:dGTPase